MSEREYIRSATIDIITNQVHDHLDENTMNMYQEMLDQGMSEERAIQLLAFYMEMYIKENFHSQEFNSEKWKAFLDNLEPIYHVPGEYEFDAQEERRNLRHIQREYGKLKSDVEELESELFVIESHLLVLHALYKIDTFEAKKIIHIVMNRLLDLKNHYTSDYTDYTTEDILSLADGLEMMCNPYINPQLHDYLSKFVDLKDESQFDYIFKNIFLCLSRILVSMDRFDLNMCGHCTIGAVTVAVEAGLVESHEGENEVVLDAPAGLIRTKAMVKDGKVESVTLTNVPAFVYKENQSVTIDGKEIKFTISFGGSFFALVDTTQLDIGEINAKTVPAYTALGMKMLDAISKEIPVKHPLLDIDSVDLVEFYGPTPNPDKADLRNVVIFGDAMADRSPCGTGTSAKLATLHHWGEIKVGEEFRYESFMGSLFKGVIKETTKVADYDAVIPMITGSAYLTGVATYLIDPTDPLKYGFQVG